MNNIKEIVDEYLIENFNKIEKGRNCYGFSWNNVLNDIEEYAKVDKSTLFLYHPNVNQYDKMEREKVRKKFLAIRKKHPTCFTTEKTIEKSLGFPYFTNKDLGVTSTKDVKFVYQTGKESKEKGTKEWTFTASNIPNESEIIEHFNIDTKKWKIVNIYHKTSFGGKYSITVQTNLLKGVEGIDITKDFVNKLNELSTHTVALSNHLKQDKAKACLLIPKQDAHWNMLDINGQNSIEDRFATFTKALLSQLEKCILTNNLEKIVYIVGSDEFNSEWTSQTTKGTPQQNILSYQESFEKVCEFNIETIKLLRFYAPKVEVILLNGNHDNYVGWHLANLLKQVFKKNESVEVNSETQNTKIVSYAKNLILLNHGDSSSPKELAAKFPVIAHDVWSNYTNYLVVCGDKHHERSADINGVICYQVPQLSKAVSSWSDKKQYIVSKPELLTFLLEEDSVSNILRKQIK